LESLDKLNSAILTYLPAPVPDVVGLAYNFANKIHADQIKASGEPFVKHLIETALLCCKLHLDIPSIAASLLHDVLEENIADLPARIQDVEAEFGEEIALLVRGVSTLTHLEFDSHLEKQAENFRMMLVALSKDVRVVLVKLCDRLQTMRTLNFFAKEQQERIALETQEIYAPLANRLGIHWLKSELEDLAFKTLKPEIYKRLEDSFGKSEEERNLFIAEVSKTLKQVLEESGVSGAVTGRVKHYYSVWQKMEKSNLTFEEVHDIIGFRIIVPTIRACYETLGIIHDAFKPVPYRFKDYIAIPKSNQYQSLHTAVVGPGGQRVEVQIRTPDMNRIAEEGVAAHWRYKEKLDPNVSFDLKWVKDLIDEKQYLKNPDEFIQSVKSDLFPEQVIVFTPKGDIVRLPSGSTPIDFGYAIHTDIGNTIAGVRINKQIGTLGQELKNGDTVEVICGKNQKPRKDWLSFAVSSKAKQRIRAFLRLQDREQSVQKGYDQLFRELKRLAVDVKKVVKSGTIQKAFEQLGYKGVEDGYAAISYGKINVVKLIGKIVPDIDLSKEPTPTKSTMSRIYDVAALAYREKAGVIVDGLDSLVVRYAKCCEPLPGDPIIGFISRGRGVNIHHEQCSEVQNFDPLRLIKVQWNNEIKTQRNVNLTVHSHDQIGLLLKMTDAISSNGANIKSAKCTTSEAGKVLNFFELTIDGAEQLKQITRALEMVPGVTKVERVTYSWYKLP
jgi:GTP diphosphokinase / guanosine-3',5'-bis(diphosphate) 3'-diphosphatase